SRPAMSIKLQLYNLAVARIADNLVCLRVIHRGSLNAFGRFRFALTVLPGFPGSALDFTTIGGNLHFMDLPIGSGDLNLPISAVFFTLNLDRKITRLN